MSSVIEFKGWEQFQQKLSAVKNWPVLFDAVVFDEAKHFESLSKRSAPVDKGKLAGSISVNKNGQASYEVVSPVKYSPYQEWGTITKVNVPAALSSYAAQFKGRGIMKTGGVKPHPFFFIQVPIVQNSLITRLKAIIERH